MSSHVQPKFQVCGQVVDVKVRKSDSEVEATLGPSRLEKLPLVVCSQHFAKVESISL